MKTFKIEITRLAVEKGYLELKAEDIGHAYAIANEWLFNPQESELSIYDVCEFNIEDAKEEITSVKKVNQQEETTQC